MRYRAPYIEGPPHRRAFIFSRIASDDDAARFSVAYLGKQANMSWWKFKSKKVAGLMLDGPVSGVRRGQIGRSEIEVGRFTYGLETATIRQWGEGASLRVGAFTSIADGLTVFIGGNHRTDWVTTYPFGHVFCDELGRQDIPGHPQTRGDINIGNDVWIGAKVTLLSGITISDGAVIAATSTVTRSVGPYEIWGGNPAKLLRQRFAGAIIDRLLTLRWWECSPATVRELAPLLSVPPDEALLDRLAEIVSRDRAQQA